MVQYILGKKCVVYGNRELGWVWLGRYLASRPQQAKNQMISFCGFVVVGICSVRSIDDTVAIIIITWPLT